MGGHSGHQPLKIDPSIEAWSKAREDSFKTFRFTQRSTRALVIMGVAIPLATYYLAKVTDDKFDIAGKRAGESLRKEQ